MKKIVYISLLFVLFASCEDQSEVTHRFVRPYTLSKSYPVYLDASEILVDIRVTLPLDIGIHMVPFKIVENDKFYFVGDDMLGIHLLKTSQQKIRMGRYNERDQILQSSAH